MPAVTRSQTKMNAIANVKQNVSPSVKQSINKVNNIVPDGNYKYASHSEYPKELSDNVNTFLKYFSNAIRKSENYHKYGLNYFDNIRLITELYYYIYESIDSVLIIDGLVISCSIQNLINTIYSKSINLVKQLYTRYGTKMTYEQGHIIGCFLRQIQETQKKIYQYVTEKPKRFHRVNYTEICEDGEVDIDYQANDPDYNPDNEDDIYQLLKDEEDDKRFYEFVEYEDKIML